MVSISFYSKILFHSDYIIAFGIFQALLIIAIIFFVLIVYAIVKSIRLRKESERLSNALQKKEEDNQYQDFTEGHLYENKE